MIDISAAFRDAVAQHQIGQTAKAEQLYRQIISADPVNVAAMNNLGMIVGGSEALELFTRAITLYPEYFQAALNLAAAYQKAEQLEDALSWYQRAATIDPTQPEVHFQIGSINQTLKRYDQAIPAYERVISLMPNAVSALFNLATVHTLLDQYEPAEKWYRWALVIEPTLEGANRNMVSILESRGRVAEAQFYRARVPHPQPLDQEAAVTPKRTVLLLSAMGSGNIPLDYLVPRQTMNRIKWYVDMATDEQGDSLPPYDIAFNAIGNADIQVSSIERTARFHERRPILNPPEKVARTRRDFLPDLLGDVPDVVIPPVIRLTRPDVLYGDPAARMTEAGIAFPVLVRPISTQGGGGLTLVESAEQLAAHKYTDADAFYFIAYHDYKSADGFFRKYRTVFVDRLPHHYHLAISPNWLVHYVSAEMPDMPWKLEEERRFLSEPTLALGAKAQAAVEAIGRKMDMDYCGIDYTVLPDGQVLVFEANATMLVHLHDPIEHFPYKHVYVPKIIQAFEDMLDRYQAKFGPHS